MDDLVVSGSGCSKTFSVKGIKMPKGKIGERPLSVIPFIRQYMSARPGQLVTLHEMRAEAERRKIPGQRDWLLNCVRVLERSGEVQTVGGCDLNNNWRAGTFMMKWTR